MNTNLQEAYTIMGEGPDGMQVIKEMKKAVADKLVGDWYVIYFTELTPWKTKNTDGYHIAIDFKVCEETEEETQQSINKIYDTMTDFYPSMDGWKVIMCRHAGSSKKQEIEAYSGVINIRFLVEKER